MPFSAPRLLAALCLILLAAALPAPAGADGGLHIVRPGDTLETLAARYLGSPGRWREIAQANPGIADPDLILPGQRIRIPPGAAAPAARIERLSRRVLDRPDIRTALHLG